MKLKINGCKTKNLPMLPPEKSSLNVTDIKIDPQLPTEWSSKFSSLHDSVFKPSIRRYNDAYRKVRARVNIGTVSPPNQKLKVPSYSSDHQQILQSKFDELEQQGVFLLSSMKYHHWLPLNLLKPLLRFVHLLVLTRYSTE